MLSKPLRNLVLSALITTTLPFATAQASPLIVSFAGQGTGPLLLIPESDTILSETIDLSYIPTSGFPFNRLFVSDSIDLSAPDPESTLFDTYFALTAEDGSGLYGSFGFTSGEYLTPTYEIFAGTFNILRGTGTLAGYRGGGTFSGFNQWSNSLEADSTMEIMGFAAIPEPAPMLLLGIGIAGLSAMSRRRRHHQSGHRPA